MDMTQLIGNQKYQKLITNANAANLQFPKEVEQYTIVRARLDEALNRQVHADDLLNAANDDEFDVLVQQFVMFSAGQQASEPKRRLFAQIEAKRNAAINAAVPSLYDTAVKRIVKLADKVNDLVQVIPLELAINASTWERHTLESAKALRELRELRLKFQAEAQFILTASKDFVPVPRTPARWEVDAVKSLHAFYDLTNLDAPQLAQLTFDEHTRKITSIAQLVYLRQHNILFSPATLDERNDRVARVIEQASAHVQGQDGRWYSKEEYDRLSKDEYRNGGWSAAVVNY